VSITTRFYQDEHERMLACADEVLRQLDLALPCETLCAGDMGFSARRPNDIEVWMPGQGRAGRTANLKLLGIRRFSRRGAWMRATVGPTASRVLGTP